jgi:hypothetical protein
VRRRESNSRIISNWLTGQVVSFKRIKGLHSSRNPPDPEAPAN